MSCTSLFESVAEQTVEDQFPPVFGIPRQGCGHDVANAGREDKLIALVYDTILIYGLEVSTLRFRRDLADSRNFRVDDCCSIVPIREIFANSEAKSSGICMLFQKESETVVESTTCNSTFSMDCRVAEARTSAYHGSYVDLPYQLHMSVYIVERALPRHGSLLL